MGGHHTGIEAWPKERSKFVNFDLQLTPYFFDFPPKKMPKLTKIVFTAPSVEIKTQPHQPLPYQTNLETY